MSSMLMRNVSAANMLVTSLTIVLLSSSSILVPPSLGQIVTGCTMAAITSFTPCMNYLTGSTNGGGGASPTAECCKSIASLVKDTDQCGCLILTGNVPFLPLLFFNRTLAVSLPRTCKLTSVPIFQCKGSATPINPPTSSVAFGPSLPPLSATTPSVLPPFMDAPAQAPGISDTPMMQGRIKPLLTPSYGVKLSEHFNLYLVVLVFGTMFEFNHI